jgi:hypothetical protein
MTPTSNDDKRSAQEAGTNWAPGTVLRLGPRINKLKDITMDTQVSTDLPTEMSEALEARPVADPISQARELVNRFSNGMPIKNWPTGDDMIDSADAATLVLASVGLAIAYHVSRVADALEK